MPLWFKVVPWLSAILICLIIGSLYLINSHILGFGCGGFVPGSSPCPSSGFECVSTIPDSGATCYSSHLAHVISDISIVVGVIGSLIFSAIFPTYLLVILLWVISNIWGRIFSYKKLLKIRNLSKAFYILTAVWIILGWYILSQVLHVPLFVGL